MKEENIKQVELYILKTLEHPIDSQALFSLYHQIGTYLYQHKFESHDLKILEWELRKKYGIVIGFTKRNFVCMMRFYWIDPNRKLFQNITWQQCVSLLRIKDSTEQQEHYKRYIETNKRKKPEDYLLLEIQKLQKNKM